MIIILKKMIGPSVLFAIVLALAGQRLSLAAPLCLGEFQFCTDSQSCVLDASLCGSCKQGQYLCPDQKTCVSSAEAYDTCPGLKGGFFDWTLSVDERVEALAKQATLQEQIAQLTNDAPAIVRLGIPSYNWLNDDEHGVRQAHATSFPNGCALGAMWDKEVMFQVGEAVGQEARALHNEFVHKGNRGHRVNGAGITMYAPNMNMVRDPRWGRAQEVYSEDPALSGYLTYMFVHGAQVGNQSSPKYMQAAACCKHYAAYDLETIPVDRHHFSAKVDARNMWETYMPVFSACVRNAEGAHVMCSYNSINGIPTCGDPKLLNGILRDQWEWPGFVVSDYDAWAQIYETHAYCPNMTCAAATGLNAGMDQEGGGTRAIDQLQAAIDAKMTTAEAVTTAFKRLFRVRLQLGMHDPPTMVPWNYLTNDSIIEGDAHTALARLAGQKAMTLYRNTHSALPLDTDIKKIAVIGPGADDGPLLLGNYAVPPDHGIPTILQSIQKAVGEDPSHFKGDCGPLENNTDYYVSGESGTQSAGPQDCCRQCGLDMDCQYFTWYMGTCYKKPSDAGKTTSAGRISAKCNSHYQGEKVFYSPGCKDAACSDDSSFQDAVKAADEAEAIVLVLGLSGSLESEGHDRRTIELPGMQEKLYTTLRAAYPDTVIAVVLVHGGTLALGTVLQANAIVDAWYPGMEGGVAVADVLFGKANPSGRASVTSYLQTSDLPPMGNTNLYPNNGTNGITYRYFTKDVQYPFGYGLSYTTFKYSDLRLSSTTAKACDYVTVNVTVTNTGDRDGDEVVQCYVKQTNASVPVPNIRLADFSRVAIAKGQSVQVMLEILPQTHAIVPDSPDIYTDRTTVEKDHVMVYVGGGQPKYYTGGLDSSFDTTTTQMLSTC